MALSHMKLLWEGLYPGFPEWEFPLHGVWGNLAELCWEGLVWTPRRAFPQIPSAGSWERSRYAIAVESYTPTQGDGRGLPRPRQIQSPPGGPWTCADQTVSYSKFLNLINFMARIYLLFPRRRMTNKEKEGLIVEVIKRTF